MKKWVRKTTWSYFIHLIRLFSLFPQKARSRPPSYAGGDSPVAIRSRSSTCDSIQSGSSPSTASNQQTRQMSNQLSTTFAQPGTSPKQQNPFPQPGRVSPGSMTNLSKGYAQSSNLSNRKSLSSSKMEVSVSWSNCVLATFCEQSN